MRHYFAWLCLLGLLLGFSRGTSYCSPNTTLQLPLDCDPITGCPPVIAATEFQSHPAFRFNNGITTATVVPSLGRVMTFGSSDKSTFNWLWNNQSPHKNQVWQNWGGSKTWLAPQSDWPQLVGAKWPPDPTWNKVIKSEVQTGGFLKTTGAVSPYSGIRINKLYGHDESGSFFIRQTAEKINGKPLQMALWSVTQINPPDAVFFLLKPKSTFSESTSQLQGHPTPQFQQKGDLACYIPSDQAASKIGISTTTPVLAALHQNQLFVLRAKPQDAVYPDASAAFTKGFPIEIFDSGTMPQRYLELEFYSPLQIFRPGSAWTFTVTWNIYTVSTSDLQSPQLWDEIAKIIKP
ncbi:MAG: DUF4380 domain-containing protein [Abditibacteriaceae bacterium]